MNTEAILLRLGISLGLGLLVGLQKERTASKVAGIRTFPLITLLGTLAGLLAQHYGGWVVVAGFVAMAAMVVIGNFAVIKSGQIDPGITTEVAMLVMFGVGAYLVPGPLAVGIVVGSAVAVLLFFKPQMHAMANAIGVRDFTAIMQFVIISLIVLPVLPNGTFDPYGVLNPFKIWLMVVLIVGISLTGYVIYKFAGHRAGSVVAGILGGLISSTATTASYARRTHGTPELRVLAVRVIIIASTVVFFRVLILIAVTGPAVLRAIGPPIAVMAVVFTLLALVASLLGPKLARQMPEQKNPTELGGAILFGVLYGVVLLAVAAAREHLGIRGIYAVSVLSGLTDMDAITLSVTGLAHEGKMTSADAWRAILAASMANIAFKSGIAAVLGGWRLFLHIALFFTVACGAGAALLVFWPW
jgi:uncharacterized membrane protein (DUF4010 family)